MKQDNITSFIIIIFIINQYKYYNLSYNIYT